MPPTYLTITKKNAGSGGDVVGPASAVASNVAVFNGTTGKLLADGGGALPVKATGAEINTGTDDAKFATAKAIADSLVVKGPSSAPTDSHVALFDGVTGKLLKDGGALPTGFSWGTTASGTTDGGLSLTLSNSAVDGAAALKLTAGNTQTNQSALANIQIGTSGEVIGLMIQGTGNFISGAVGVGKGHMIIWGDTANQDVYAINIGYGTSFTTSVRIGTLGYIQFTTPSAANASTVQITQNGLVSTHFRRIISETNTGNIIWVSDGTTPNAALSGTAGDICIGGDAGNIYRCTGTTNWTAM